MESVIKASHKVPEVSIPQNISIRLNKLPHLYLVVHVDEAYADFKLGYELSVLRFYSWIGGGYHRNLEEMRCPKITSLPRVMSNQKWL
ncbi:MAG: hypothetical protein AAGA18_13890 [Verrucomicrobiota bacterium]